MQLEKIAGMQTLVCAALILAAAEGGYAATETVAGSNFVANGLIKAEMAAPPQVNCLILSVWDAAATNWLPVLSGNLGLGIGEYFEALANEPAEEIRTVRTNDAATLTFKLVDRTKDNQGKGGDGKLYQTYRVTVQAGKHKAAVEMIEEAAGHTNAAAWKYAVLPSAAAFVFSQNVGGEGRDFLDLSKNAENKYMQLAAGPSLYPGVFNPEAGVVILIRQPKFQNILSYQTVGGVPWVTTLTGRFEIYAAFVGTNTELPTALEMVDRLKMEDGGLPLPSGAKQVFAEDFSAGGNVTEKWAVVSGNWRIRDGALYGDSTAVIALKQDLGSNLRVEYTAWSDDAAPCDLDVVIGSNGGKDYMNPGCLFQFGGMLNSKNSIRFNGAELILQEGGTFPGGIVKGKKHRIIAQKKGRNLVLFVDGKLLMEARASGIGSVELGKKAAFYIHSSGAIDDVAIYALPEDASVAAWSADEKATVFQCFDFEKGTIGQKPVALGTEENGGAAVIADDPTWVHQGATTKIVGDKCLAIAASAKPLKITVPFAPLVSGAIELDLNFKKLGQDGLRIGLIDASGKEAGAVGVDKGGTWYMALRPGSGQVDRNGTNKMDQPAGRVSTCGVSVPLIFTPGRWHTLRLGFNAAAGTFYSGYNNFTAPGGQGKSHLAVIGSYLYFDDKPLAAGTTQTISAACITVSPQTEVRIDNLGIVGPVGLRKVNGKEYYGTVLRDLMGWTFPPRKDPFDLKFFTVRNLYGPPLPGGSVMPLNWDVSLKAAYGGDKLIYEKFNVYAAARYNELLVRQAFVTEQRQMLERTAFHLKAADRLSAELAKQVNDAVQIENNTVALLNDLFRAYGQAYIDNRDVSRLTNSFPPIAEKLDKEIKKFDALAADILDRLPKQVLVTKKPAVPCPLPFLTPDQFNYEWRDGQFYRDGEPDFVFLSFNEGRPGYWPQERYDILNKIRGVTQRIPQGRFYGWDYLADQSFNKPSFAGEVGPKDKPLRGETMAPYLYNGWEARPPKWWMDTNASDPDVLMRNAQGSLAGPDPNRPEYTTLNYWNPKVRQYLRDSHAQLAMMLKNSTIGPFPVLFRLGWEATFFGTGYNAGAREAFRKHLEDEYKTIANLNKAWNASYESFAKIEPPANEIPPSGLHYEFKRFLQQGLKERMLLVREGLQKGTPGVPTMIDFHTVLNYNNAGFDLPALFESCDIVGFHCYDNDEHHEYYSNRQLDSLRKAFGNTLGNGEYAASMNCPDFDEDIVKNSVLHETFHQMMWGQALPSCNSETGFGGWVGSGATDHRLGGMVLRYMASHHALIVDRARRVGHVALKAPSVTPDVAILEATSSWYNEPAPQVRGGMSAAALELEKSRFNYGFLYEQLLMDGRQSLNGIQTVIVPAGYCMAGKLSDQLMSWVSSGGTLICYGAPGVYNSYGQPDGRLLNAVFPDVAWKEDTAGWHPTGAAAPKSIQPDGAVGLYQGALGRGKVFIFSSNGANAPTQAKTGELAATNTVRSSGSADGRFDLTVRADRKHTYIYVLNSSLTETVESDVFVRGKYSEAQDAGLQRPVYIPLKQKDGTVVFKLRLAPAEGTLVQLAR